MTSTNYQLAKQAIRKAKREGANVLVFYDKFSGGRSLKVLYFWREHGAVKQNARMRKLHKELRKLSSAPKPPLRDSWDSRYYFKQS